MRGGARGALGAAGLALCAAACSLFANLDQYEGPPVDAGVEAADDAVSCGDTKTSQQSCGACGHDCQGASCSMGFCAQQPVVTGDNQVSLGPLNGYPVFLAIDGAQMFWADAFTAIKSRALDGGAVSYSAFPSFGATQEVLSLALGTSSVFFTTAEGTPLHSHLFRIDRAAIGASSPQFVEIATQTDANHVIDSVCADPNAIFWGVRDAVGAMLGSIETAPPNAAADAGGTVVQDKARPHALAITPKSIVWIYRTADVSVTKTGVILTAARPTGSPINLAAGAVPFDLLAVGPDAYFAWSDGTTTSIRRAALDGTRVDTLVPNVTLSGDVLFSDGTTLVWSTLDAQASTITLWVCSLASSCTDPLAVAALDISVRAKIGSISVGPSVAIGGSWLYWAEPTNHAIRRVSILRH